MYTWSNQKDMKNLIIRNLFTKNHIWVEASKFLVYLLWVWNERIDGFFKQKGFRQCKLNTISYVQMEQDQPIVYTMLYVNDLLTFCKNVDEIKEVKKI